MEEISRTESHKDNPYYIGYLLMTNYFDNKDTNEGIRGTLHQLKHYLKAEDASLYKLNERNEYVLLNKSDRTDNEPDYIQVIINGISELIENKRYFNFNLAEDNKNMDLIFIQIETEDNKYVLAINEPKVETKTTGDERLEVIINSLEIILERFDHYERMKRNAYEDGLTGLENRYQYEKKISEINSSFDKYIFAIFDLFRLKYINDNYSHKIGDDYIKKAAEILAKYFPRYKYVSEGNGEYKRVETGTNVYRIGGDEFVVISKNENHSMISLKASLAAEEMKNYEFAKENNIDVGLNYGISERTELETGEILYINADQELKEDKTKTYKKLGIDRRK